jgi:hypothetical protein
MSRTGLDVYTVYIISMCCAVCRLEGKQQFQAKQLTCTRFEQGTQSKDDVRQC